MSSESHLIPCIDKDCGLESGFTLAEMLVAIVVLTIMYLTAIPRLATMYDSINKRNSEVQLLQDIRYAQAMAVEQGCQGILSISGDHTQYMFGCDYVPFSILTPPTWDTLMFTRTLPKDITISSDDLVIFNTRGQVVDSIGALATRTITLDLAGTSFSVGLLRPTGFLEFTR